MFSGWPGQPAYLTATAQTDANATKEVSNWQTKRERGDKAYGMNWSVQVGIYQKFFKGKTVAEIEHGLQNTLLMLMIKLLRLKL